MKNFFTLEDMEQFYQLIGYSVSGYGEMSEFDEKKIAKFDSMARKIMKVSS